MIPPDAYGEFVARMEDLLVLFAEPLSAARPAVWLHEPSNQLIGEVRRHLPSAPGRPKRLDYDYRRSGTVATFVFVRFRGGWRMLRVTDHRTKLAGAHMARELLDVHFPYAGIVHLIMDNLNSHTTASLYEVFDTPEARRLAERLEMRYTPNPASWCNIPEIEIGVLSKHFLYRRFEDPADVRSEIAAWEHEPNDEGIHVNWQGTIQMARVKVENV